MGCYFCCFCLFVFCPLSGSTVAATTTAKCPPGFTYWGPGSRALFSCEPECEHENSGRFCSRCICSKTTTSNTNKKCKKWCASDNKSWKKKCAWPGMCGGCPECSGELLHFVQTLNNNTLQKVVSMHLMAPYDLRPLQPIILLRVV